MNKNTNLLQYIRLSQTVFLNRILMIALRCENANWRQTNLFKLRIMRQI